MIKKTIPLENNPFQPLVRVRLQPEKQPARAGRGDGGLRHGQPHPLPQPGERIAQVQAQRSRNRNFLHCGILTQYICTDTDIIAKILHSIMGKADTTITIENEMLLDLSGSSQVCIDCGGGARRQAPYRFLPVARPRHRVRPPRRHHRRVLLHRLQVCSLLSSHSRKREHGIRSCSTGSPGTSTRHGRRPH